MELVDVMAEIVANLLLMPKLCRMFLGEGQKKRLYDHLRVKDTGFRSRRLLRKYRRSSILTIQVI